jgi:hypothetical protein
MFAVARARAKEGPSPRSFQRREENSVDHEGTKDTKKTEGTKRQRDEGTKGAGGATTARDSALWFHVARVFQPVDGPSRSTGDGLGVGKPTCLAEHFLRAGFLTVVEQAFLSGSRKMGLHLVGQAFLPALSY